jgi:hypothetical protein
MKARIEMEEQWPFYDITLTDAGSVEISDATLARWIKAKEDFKRWQDELEELYESQFPNSDA